MCPGRQLDSSLQSKVECKHINMHFWSAGLFIIPDLVGTLDFNISHFLSSRRCLQFPLL